MAERLADVLQVPAADRDEFLHVARAAPSPAADTTISESRLPFAPKALIGRDSERTAIVRLLSGTDRLVTIVGPGGAGKTRLAIEVARNLAATIPSVWIDLTPLTTASQIPAAISRAVGASLTGVGTPVDVLVSALRDRSIILVLDNLEHLIGTGSGVKDLVHALLGGTENLRLLITSRTRPQIAGERTLCLAGLAILGQAEESDSAVQLFAERAAQADHTFALGPSNQQAIIEICSAVGGIPLAIELAAASVPLMSPAEIALEIARGLDVLSVEHSALPERQRGPRVVFDRSWKLLRQDAQQALARLSVFRGGWTRTARRKYRRCANHDADRTGGCVTGAHNSSRCRINALCHPRTRATVRRRAVNA